MAACKKRVHDELVLSACREAHKSVLVSVRARAGMSDVVRALLCADEKANDKRVSEQGARERRAGGHAGAHASGGWVGGWMSVHVCMSGGGVGGCSQGG
jgi:hypothetical protein